MAPRKQVTSCVTSKGKVKATTGGTASKLTSNQLLTEGTASALSQEPSSSSHPPQQQENQLFQMLRKMKEQIKKHQLQSDRERSR